MTESSIARGFGTVLVVRVALTITFLVTDVAIGRYLGPEIRGSLAIMLGLSGLFGSLSDLGLTLTVNRVGHHTPGRLPAMVPAVGLVTLAVSAAVGIGLATIGARFGIFGSIGQLPVRTRLAVIILLVGESLLMFVSHVATTVSRPVIPLLARMVRRMVVLCAAIIALFGATFDPLFLLILASGSSALLISVLVLGRLPISYSNPQLPSWPETAYGLSGLPSRLAERMLSRLDVVILGLIAPASNVGRYAVALAIADLLTIVSGSLNQVLFGKNFTTDPNRARSIVRHATAAAALIAAFVGLGSWFSLERVYGAQYREVPLVIMILLPGAVAYSYLYVAIPVINQVGRISRVSLGMIVGSIVTAVLLVPAYSGLGINGAAAASTVGISVAAVIVRREFRRSTDPNRRSSSLKTPGL